MEHTSIAIDLGGTIENSWPCKQAWFKAREIDIGLWPRSRGEVIACIGGNAALYDQMAAEVYSDTNVIHREPVEGVVTGIQCLAKRHRIRIVTSRPNSQRRITVEWLVRQGLARWITEVAFLGPNASKLAWCERGGVSYLIDDDIRHLEPIKEGSSITAIHYCPSSLEQTQDDQRFRRIGSWNEIVELIQETCGLQG